MNNYKKPYELSIWDDILTYNITRTGSAVSEDVISLEGIEGQVNYQYFNEVKIAIIGSDGMQSPIRAFNPVLTKELNGSYKLVFSMYYRYWDDEIGDFANNPFVNLLVNERKIKFCDGKIGTENAKWYDLVIKNVQENSENYTITYTAAAQFVEELSKTGFNIELDPELGNNMGTINELCDIILEESDWKRHEDDTILRQYVEEPLYRIKLPYDIPARLISLNSNNDTQIELKTGSVIYALYSCFSNKDSKLQFLIPTKSINNISNIPVIEETDYTVDEKNIITNFSNCYFENVNYREDLMAMKNYVVIDGREIEAIFSRELRGKRIVEKQKTHFESKINEYVGEYIKNDITYNGFTETIYLSPVAVKDYITNGSDFGDDVGWRGYNGAESSFQSNLNMNENELDLASVKSYIAVDFSNGGFLYNSGISDSASQIKSFSIGEEYIFGIKASSYTKQGNPTYVTPVNFTSGNFFNNFKVIIATYEIENGQVVILDTYFDSKNSSTSISVPGFDGIAMKMTALKSISATEFLNKRKGIFIQSTSSEKKLLIEKAEFFEYVKDSSDELIVPGGELKTEIKTKYYFYDPNENLDITSKDDISYAYVGYSLNGYLPKYDENKEKVRHIEAKESNRFNLIQNLCETFECWAEFIIEHDENGKVLLEDLIDEQNTVIGKRQIKSVRFNEFITKDNYAGFKYGINLKNINRTIDSEPAGSKIIVKDNSNEFGTGGFCSIARAFDNPSGENFILDFSYYISQGLIDPNILTADLYLSGTSQKYLGYYMRLKAENANREKLIEELSLASTDKLKIEADLQSYNIALDENLKKLEEEKILFKQDIGIDYEDFKNDPNKKIKNEDVQKRITAIQNLTSLVSKYETLSSNSQKFLDDISDRIDTIESDLEKIVENKKIIHKDFNTKYSRFIKEGSWISEEYIDDNLYYMDAVSTAHSAAQPKITYTINVIDVAALNEDEYGLANYKFDIGDLTFIEDTEFFGWTSSKTAYREQVIVSTVIKDFDNPEKNQIKIQNYKTKFEDLFQRITATTTAVEYASGGYNRAATILQNDGSIQPNYLKNSLENNTLTLMNARDESVIIDSNGITTTSLNNLSNMVRIVSGGIFLSKDGGLTWNTGINGYGINASYITTGQLDTSVIRIMNGSYPSFRWDKYGLSAYEITYEKNSEDVLVPSYFNFNKYVRFDQFGLYGIDSSEEFIASSIDDVKKNSLFSITWDGFQLKSSLDGSRISISKDNHIQVFYNENERIKIGDLGNNNYGIRICNDNKESVLETGSNGTLWLKNKLHIETNGATGEALKVAIGAISDYFGTQGIEVESPELFTGNQVEYDTAKDEAYYRVFDANNKFVVWEDGSIRAADGYFTGTTISDSSFSGELKAASGTFTGELKAATGSFTGSVNATSGNLAESLTIGSQGNVTIGDFINVIDQSKAMEIISKNGLIFSSSEGITTPNQISLYVKITGFDDTVNKTIEWYGSNDYSDLESNKISTNTSSGLSINNPFDLLYNENLFSLGNTYYIKAKVTIGNDIVEDYITISQVKDSSGVPILVYEFDTSEIRYYLTKEVRDNKEVYVYRPKAEQIIGSFYETVNGEQIKFELKDNITVSLLIDGKIIIPTEIYQINADDSSETNTIYNKISLSLTGLFNKYIVYESADEVNTFLGSKLDGAFLRITISKNKNSIENIIIPFKYLLAEDLMNFTVNSEGLMAAIEGKALKFDAEGLTVENGKFEIVKTDVDELTTPVLSFDPEIGQLIVNGDIITSKGSIANFIIKENCIESVDGGLKLYSSDENGQSSIIVDKIAIGENATITNFIKLGSAYLLNPAANDGNILTCDKIDGESNKIRTVTLSQDGKFTIGSLSENHIVIDGNGPTMWGGHDINMDWFINPNEALFKNVTVSGVINTAIFNKQTIQNIGSMLVFRESGYINEISEDRMKFSIRENIHFVQADVFYNDVERPEQYIIIDYLDENNLSTRAYRKIIGYDDKYYTLDAALPTKCLGGDLVTYIGTPGADHIFSISSGTKYDRNDGNIYGNAGFDFATSGAIVLSKLIEVNEDIETGTKTANYEKKVILGDLTEIFNSSIFPNDIFQENENYGLYSNNVLLQGTLTTTNEGYSAGISTSLLVSGKIEDNDPIVIWAGARDSIEEAAFYVTRNGNLYASKGQFSKSLLSEANIQANYFSTYGIYPVSGENNNLKLFSTDIDKIIFSHDSDGMGTDNIGTDYFSFDNNGMYYCNNELDIPFINIGNGSIVLENVSNIKTKSIIIDKTNETEDVEISLEQSMIKINNGKRISFGETTTAFYRDIIFDEEADSTTEFVSNKKDFIVKNDIHFGERNKHHYEPIYVNNEFKGYDLYIGG